MSRQRLLRLVSSKGWLLSDPLETIQSAVVQDGDNVTAVAQQGRLAATQKAFAAILVDGRVVGWGDPASGGHCSRVKNELTNVHQIPNTVHRSCLLSHFGRWKGVQHLLTDARQNNRCFCCYRGRWKSPWGNEAGGDCSTIHR